MLAIQSDIAKYHCLYTQRAIAFQRPGLFIDLYSIKIIIAKIHILHNIIMEGCYINIWSHAQDDLFCNLKDNEVTVKTKHMSQFQYSEFITSFLKVQLYQVTQRKVTQQNLL